MRREDEQGLRGECERDRSEGELPLCKLTNCAKASPSNALIAWFRAIPLCNYYLDMPVSSVERLLAFILSTSSDESWSERRMAQELNELLKAF